MKFCTNCGTKANDNGVFCTNCGMKFPEQQPAPAPVPDAVPMYENPAPAPVPDAVPVYENPAPAPVPDTVPVYENPAPAPVPDAVPVYENPAPAPVPDAVPMYENPAPKKFKKDKKLLKTFGIVLAAVLAVAAVIIIFSLLFGNKKSTAVDLEKLPLLYVNEDYEVVFKQHTNNTLKTLGDSSDISYSSMGVTLDGERFFFKMEDDLYYRDIDKKDSSTANMKIDSNVSSYIFSSDGKAVFYIKKGDLYRSNLKKSEKYAEDVVNIQSVSSNYKSVIAETLDGEFIYANGKYIKELGDASYAYFTDESAKKIVVCEWDRDYNEKISIVGTGKNDKPYEIDRKIQQYTTNEDCSVFYYIKKDDLYYKKGKGEPVKILEDADYISECYDEDDYSKREFFAISEDDELYYLDGKKALKVCDDFSSFSDTEGRIIKCDDGDDAYLRNGKKIYKLEMPDDIYSFTVSGDYCYYIEDYDYYDGGKLMRAKIGSKKINFNSAKMLADDVTRFSVYDDKIVQIWCGSDEFGIYDGKYKKVSDDYSSIYYIDNKKIVFMEDGDTLCLYDGSKRIELADDVEDVAAFSSKYIYFIDEDDVLYQAKTNGKHVQIDEDVSSLVDPQKYFDMIYN